MKSECFPLNARQRKIYDASQCISLFLTPHIVGNCFHEGIAEISQGILTMRQVEEHFSGGSQFVRNGSSGYGLEFAEGSMDSLTSLAKRNRLQPRRQAEIYGLKHRGHSVK